MEIEGEAWKGVVEQVKTHNEFYIFRTMHLRIILVGKEVDAQFLL
jgi:hypothetical protein